MQDYEKEYEEFWKEIVEVDRVDLLGLVKIRIPKYIELNMKYEKKKYRK